LHRTAKAWLFNGAALTQGSLKIRRKRPAFSASKETGLRGPGERVGREITEWRVAGQTALKWKRKCHGCECSAARENRLKGVANPQYATDRRPEGGDKSPVEKKKVKPQKGPDQTAQSFNLRTTTKRDKS